MTIPTSVPWSQVAVFLAATFGGVWLAGTALRLTGQDAHSASAVPFLVLAMLTPTLGVLVAAMATGGIRRPRALLTTTGVVPLRPLPRLVGYTVVGLLMAPLLAVLALAVSALAGTYRFHEPLPMAGLGDALTAALMIFPLGLVLVFGEEWGWSYLLPKLLPLGLWPGLLLSGVVWGLFHAPFTLAGYHFPDHPDGLGVVFFTITSVLLGTLLGWLRIASGSIWPAVAAHTAANFVASQLPAALGRAADPLSSQFSASLAGWPGWIVMAVTIAGLVVTGQLRKPAATAP
jgi:membrane protease YdiL (CAAX protease family)